MATNGKPASRATQRDSWRDSWRDFWRRWGLGILLVVLAVGAGFWALRPQPVPVDTATIVQGNLEVTVSEEGRARVRDVYAVAAPVAGLVERTPREVGDEVKAGETVVAILRPSDPGFLDARARREAEAIVAAVRAMIESGRAQVVEAEAQLARARREHARAVELSRTQAVSESRLDEARTAEAAAEAKLTSAKATLVAYQYGLQMAQARLIGPQGDQVSEDGRTPCCLRLYAPVDGRVLTVHQKSEQPVTAGTALIEVGDPRRLEIAVELLSSDAVRVPVGASARIDGWGGPKPLMARVRHVEPAGFTKTSALGIEEQRVRVILDFEKGTGDQSGLGHGYRVMAHIAVERLKDVPLVPIGALFRRGETWSVFVVDGGDRVSERAVEIGERTGRQAAVRSGLKPGERVVLHPSDRVSEGTRVRERDDRGMQ